MKDHPGRMGLRLPYPERNMPMSKESKAFPSMKTLINRKYGMRNRLKAFHTMKTRLCPVLYIIYSGEKSFVRKS